MYFLAFMKEILFVSTILFNSPSIMKWGEVLGYVYVRHPRKRFDYIQLFALCFKFMLYHNSTTFVKV